MQRNKILSSRVHPPASENVFGKSTIRFKEQWDYKWTQGIKQNQPPTGKGQAVSSHDTSQRDLLNICSESTQEKLSFVGMSTKGGVLMGLLCFYFKGGGVGRAALPLF